jgi:hypothetical protein
MRLALHSRRRHGLPSAAASAAALDPLRLLATAAAMSLESGLVAPRLTVRPRARRGCDRERGNAGCEKNPGHKSSPLNSKTVRTAHRSHRQTGGTRTLPH